RGRRRSRWAFFRSLLELHQQLAEILTPEKTDEGARRGLQAVHDVVAVLEPAFGVPAPALGEKIGHRAGVVGHEKAVHEDAAGEQRTPVWSADRPGGIVLGDEPAERNAGADVD